MPSKGILDRHRIAKAIVAAARTHAEKVGERLQEVFASAVEERLTGQSSELPPRRLDGVELDLGALAAQLQPALDELGQALREVDEQARSREATLLERDLALDAFDTAVGSVGRILIAFDRLSGFRQLGSRIRLTLPVRRRRGTAPDEGSPLPDSGEETPPAEDGAPSDVPLSDLLTGLPEASDT